MALKYIADRGKAGFNSGALRMHAALNNSADSGNEIDRRRDADDARGSADDVDHVVGAATGADGVPMSIESADGDGDSRF